LKSITICHGDAVHVVRDGATDPRRAVGENLNAAQHLRRPPDELLDRFPIERVDRNWNDLAPGLLSDFHRSLPQPRLRPSPDRHVAAFARQLPRNRLSHAGATAGNDRLLTVKRRSMRSPQYQNPISE
jgi:hypothetical protein